MKKAVIFVTFVVLTFLAFIESALAEPLYETKNYIVHQTVSAQGVPSYIVTEKHTLKVLVIPAYHINNLSKMNHTVHTEGDFYRVSDLPVGPKKSGDGIAIELPPVDDRSPGDLEDFGPAGDDNIGPLPIF